jgi:hypothetical protein
MSESAEPTADAGKASYGQGVAPDDAVDALGPFVAMFLALNNSLSSRKAGCEMGWSPAG